MQWSEYQKGSSHMLTVITAETEEFIEALFGPRDHNSHMQAYRWHLVMAGMNSNYLDDIAIRQTEKRAAGIGPEGLCRA